MIAMECCSLKNFDKSYLTVKNVPIHQVFEN